MHMLTLVNKKIKSLNLFLELLKTILFCDHFFYQYRSASEISVDPFLRELKGLGSIDETLKSFQEFEKINSTIPVITIEDERLGSLQDIPGVSVIQEVKQSVSLVWTSQPLFLMRELLMQM